MPDAIKQISAAYQQPGARPIPTDWPRQNPVSWADTPDPATGMTPRQLGQGVIGAGKEIPQLVQAGLPQGDVVGQTQNPMANTAIGKVLNRYLFDPMTIRGPAQQTGARMMDVLSLLHGMNPVGMEEAVPRVPRYAEDFPVGSEEWWKPDWKPSAETMRSISNEQKRLYQLQQALLNRARRGEKAIPYEHLPLSVRTRALPPEAPGGAPMTPEETAKYPNVVERPPSGAAYPPGSIGAEAQRQFPRAMTPAELEQADAEFKKAQQERSANFGLTPEELAKSYENYQKLNAEIREATKEPFVIEDPDTGKQYGSFTEAIKDTGGKLQWSNWKSWIKPLKEGSYPPGSIGAEAQKPGQQPEPYPMPPEPDPEETRQAWEHMKKLRGEIPPSERYEVMQDNEGIYPWKILDNVTGKTVDKFPTKELADHYIFLRLQPPQSWKWPYLDEPRFTRDHKGLLSPNRPMEPWNVWPFADIDGQH